jgi:hypothetical protein
MIYRVDRGLWKGVKVALYAVAGVVGSSAPCFDDSNVGILITSVVLGAIEFFRNYWKT